jgi:iron-sulfur cluster repair protein YtfE (RIC family)
MMRAIALPAGGWQGGGMNMPPAPDDGLLLENRAGLPEEFSLVLTGLPRASWDAHPDFNGLAAFWLDRHLAFRRMLDALGADVRARIDGGMAAEVHAARLSRLGSRLLGDLVGHHQIEDDVYFPELARLEPRIARGFDMLDADHNALHGLIDRFVTGANAVLAETGDAPQREAAGRFLADLDRFDRLLTRHLADEEDLVLPVVLKHRVG